MMMTIVTNPCNQVIPVLLFVGIVFILIGLGCIAASNRVSKFELLCALLYINLKSEPGSENPSFL
jgi:hypothetical protein